MNTAEQQSGHTPLPWGMEITDRNICIGPMRRDGDGKIATVVVSFDIQGVMPRYRDRALADAELIVSSVNRTTDGVTVEHLKTMLVEMSKEDVYRNLFEKTMKTLRLSLDELARMRMMASMTVGVIKGNRIEGSSGAFGVISSEPTRFEMAAMRSRVEKVEREAAELRQWKREQMHVSSNTRYHEIAQEIGLEIGADIAPAILPAIRELKVRAETAEKELARVRALGVKLYPDPEMATDLSLARRRAAVAERELKTLYEQIEAIVPNIQRLEESVQRAKKIIA